MVDEIPNLVVFELHELVRICQTDRAASVGRGWRRQCASKGVAEGDEEVTKEMAKTKNFMSAMFLMRDLYVHDVLLI